jgi:hypothetical protein
MMEGSAPSEHESPNYLRDQAAHARRLALASYNDALRARLRAIADEFDAEADAIKGRDGGS